MAMISLVQTSELIKQGAEAKVYKGYPFKTKSEESGVQDEAWLIKYRFEKTYRHPELDKILTRQRLSFEARCLVKCAKAGVRVPGVRCVSLDEGVLCLEWIDGKIVRDVLGGISEDGKSSTSTCSGDLRGLILKDVGREIAKMHLSGVVHGDLTTSNMIVHKSVAKKGDEEGDEIVLIDFGLASITAEVEDRAVDLYVLERAFSSTHPEHDGEDMAFVLGGYSEMLGKKTWLNVSRRLDEVRLRGRKRSMVG